jgi:hypothetical protein
MVSYEKQLEFDFMRRHPDYVFADGAQGSTTSPEYPKGANGPTGPYATFDPPKDDVNQPEHYTLGKIEVYDFINAWDLSFAQGNVIKYTVRAPYKGSELKDLKKARWYLDKLIEQAEEQQ